MFKNFSNRFLAVCACTALGNCYAITLCLKTEDEKIRLQFNLPDDGSEQGSVTYKTGKGSIKVSRTMQSTISDKSQIPATVITYFSEFTPERRSHSGVYEMTSTGGMFGRMKYRNLRNGKVFNFIDDSESYGANECIWRNIENN